MLGTLIYDLPSSLILSTLGVSRGFVFGLYTKNLILRWLLFFGFLLKANYLFVFNFLKSYY